ncbi:MAG TPA: type VI secretion system baseplate subunit TssG [Acidisphaera sp.]|nr:type VI secretion system baseplate subunit TssG [Acidisphaera sp.]
MADADWPAPDTLTAPAAAAAPADDDARAPAPPDDLIARLAARPTDFGFYQVMRRLEALYRDRPRLGNSVRPSQDAVRLAQEPSPIFAPASLAGFEMRDDGRPPKLLVHFFGLFGPDGPLALHLTHYARERRRNARDPHFQHFADIFHHRALSLLYRAWADVRPTIAFDRPAQDRFAVYLGALIGLGMDSLRDRDAMPQLTKLHFAGRLANQTRHAEGLSAILSSFFTMPVRVETFIGTWLTMPTTDRTALGGDPRTGTIGRSVLVGGRAWSRQAKFRIVFGPLSLADYLRLLPGGLSFHRLIPIVRNYVGDVLLWDVNIVLKREEVPPTLLGQQGRLGWTSWMGTRRSLDDAADLFLDASADSFAQRIDERTATESHSADHPPAAEAVA